MSKERRIEEADIKALRSINGRNDEIVYELGAIAVEIEAIEKSKARLTQRRVDLLKEATQIAARAEEMGRDLSKRYGEGRFDLERGVFIEAAGEDAR